MKTKLFGEQKNCLLDTFKPYQRPKLSDPAHGTPRWQPRRSRRVRCSAWLARIIAQYPLFKIRDGLGRRESLTIQREMLFGSLFGRRPIESTLPDRTTLNRVQQLATEINPLWCTIPRFAHF